MHACSIVLAHSSEQGGSAKRETIAKDSHVVPSSIQYELV